VAAAQWNGGSSFAVWFLGPFIARSTCHFCAIMTSHAVRGHLVAATPGTDGSSFAVPWLGPFLANIAWALSGPKVFTFRT
jgi:hypothetical protein